MEQERVFDRRLDYIRYTIKGSPSEVLLERERFEGLCTSFVTAVHGRQNGKSFKTYPKHNKDPHIWETVFEAWGRAADEMAKELEAKDWINVSRVDWREEIDTPPLSLSELEQRAKMVNDTGRRITRDDSRVRSRRNGRDGGGVLLGVGSHASDTRLTIYKRGDAEYAVEAQLSGKQLQALVQQAFLEHSQEPFPDMYTLMRRISKEKLHTLVQQRFAMPFDVLSSKVGMDNQLEIESLLGLKTTRLKSIVFSVCHQVDKDTALLWVQEYYNDYWEFYEANPLKLLPLPEEEPIEGE